MKAYTESEIFIMNPLVISAGLGRIPYDVFVCYGKYRITQTAASGTPFAAVFLYYFAPLHFRTVGLLFLGFLYSTLFFNQVVLQLEALWHIPFFCGITGIRIHKYL